MKKKYFYIAVLSLSLTGCSDVLDTLPTDRLSSEIYWQSDEDAELAANAIYTYLEDPHALLSKDIMTDLGCATFNNSDEARVETDIADTQTGLFSFTWNNMYKGIRLCNDYMHNVGNIEVKDQSRVKACTAEVRTLRAYFYARLVSYFGGVPLITKPINIGESKNATRNSAAEIYDFIENELNAAATDLPVKASAVGRVTKGAALGILARTMLFAAGNVTGDDNRTQAYLQKAKKAADAVIALGVYDLLPNYHELFDYAHENNIEVIFDKQYIKDKYANSVMNNFGAVSLGNNGSAISVTKQMVDEFETVNGKMISDDPTYDPRNPYINRDPRLKYTVFYPGAVLPDGSIYNSIEGCGTADAIGASYQVAKTGLLSAKYINAEDMGTSNRTNCGINLIIMRYAEILLIAAETRIELNTELTAAAAYINKVRHRSDVDMPPITATSQSELRKAVRHERIVELGLEGHRFFDIRRYGIAEQAATFAPEGITYVDDAGNLKTAVYSNYRKVFSARDYLWPIPYNELQLVTGLKQNKGWNDTK